MNLRRISLVIFVLLALLLVLPVSGNAQSCPYCGKPIADPIKNCDACYQSLQNPQDIYTLAYCYDYTHCDSQGNYCYDYWEKKLRAEYILSQLYCGNEFNYLAGNNCSTKPQSTTVENAPGCWTPGQPPLGCNQGFQPYPPTPGATCQGGGSGGSGGGGGCSGKGTGSSCPEQYVDDLCGKIPCGFRPDCNCNCECGGDCQMGGGSDPKCKDIPGGGGGSSPTPTPSPYCTVSCFDLSGRAGGAGGGSLDVVGGGAETDPAPTVLPPYITGTINYSGYNGFNCGSFKDGRWYSGPCPTDSGGSGLGQTSSWQYPVKYNMLCGGSPHTYTAEVDADERVGSGSDQSDGNAEPTPTADPLSTPTPTTGSLYPQGCSAGITLTPTETDGAEEDQGSIGLAGSQGGTSSASACSCSITLACQDKLYDSPNTLGSGCSSTCNFAVNPDYPLFNQATAFYTTENTPENNISFSFDDGSADVFNQQSINHTFVNAGVYDVALACSDTNEVCTRRVNVYCDNGVVPTPTATPTPTPGSWVKVKDAAVIKTGHLFNPIPDPVTAYDGDDSGDPDCQNVPLGSDIRCFAFNQPGIVSASQSIDTGTAPLSRRDWNIENYTVPRRMDPKTFIQYVKSRKRYKTIEHLSEIETNTINLIFESVTINETALETPPPYVLLVDGDVTIDVAGSFNPAGSVAILSTGQLNVTAQVTEINGIFISKTFDAASDVETTVNPLKIIGNLVVIDGTDSLAKRARSDNSQPSVLIVHQARKFIDVLPLLSIRKYIWQELAP